MPMGNNMGLTCQPNFNGPQPGHCVLHHVNTLPVSHIRQQIVTVQNSRTVMRETHPQEQQSVDRLSSYRKPGSKEINFTCSGPCMIVGDKIFNFSKEDVANSARKITNDKEYEAALAQFKKDQASLGKIKQKKTDAERKERKEQWKQQSLEHKKRLQEAMPPVQALDKRLLNIESRLSQNISLAVRPPVTFLSPVPISHVFLSHAQRSEKAKEQAECQSALCAIGTEAKWLATDLAQGTSFAAGMVAGVPAGLYETVDGIVKTASHPADAYSALKALADSGNILGNLGSAVKQSWADSIDRMEAAYQTGSISGAFNAGVEGGKLTTDIGGLLTGGAGLLKSGAVALEKSVANAAGKAESAVKTAQPPVSKPDRMADYMAPKVVPESSEAVRLASQQALKSAQFMTMPPLENPFLGKGLPDRLTFATPQQTKVAGQLLDIGIKAGITGITALTLKEVADNVTADELNHTDHYLSSLQDKYAPAHTGNPQIPDTALHNTGGHSPSVPQAPSHTGNNQIPVPGVAHTGNTAGVADTGGYILINPGYDPLSTKDIVYLSEKPSSKIDSIISETLSGKKNFTSSTILTSDEALAAGLKFLGAGYKEIGKSGSGVYHSADGTKEFRIDSSSLNGAHLPGVPHVHFGVKDPETGKYLSNNHVPYKD